MGLFRLFERRNCRPFLGPVFARLPVDDQLGLRSVLLLLNAVETALVSGLASQRTGLDHLLDEVGDLEDFALLIVCAALVDSVGDVSEHIDADQIHCAEGGAARVSHGGAGDGVHLVHLVVHFHHGVEGRRDAEDADPVADEVRRVLAEDDALAETEPPEIGEELEDLRLGLLTGHELEQPHVTHRVEEVGDQEVLLEVLRPALGHACNRQTRGVGRHDASGFPDLVETGEDLLFDVESFDNHLDDPVAIRESVPVVFEVADLDQRQVALRVESRRLRLLDAVEPRHREFVAKARVLSVRPFFSSSSVSFGGTMSRSNTGMPALARWAAMPEPITPAPNTAALRISVAMDQPPISINNLCRTPKFRSCVAIF